MHISQPSVSTHIKALEQELGLTLFIRTPKGMVLSHEGKQIKSKAELTLQAAAAVRHQADKLRKNIAGKARIGLNIDAQYLRATELLKVLQREFHKLDLHFFQRHSLQAQDQLQNGLLDAAFVFSLPINAGIVAKRLTSFGIVAVGPYKWRHRFKNLSLDKLVKFPWIWTDDSCPFNGIIRQLFEPLNRLPEKTVVVDDDTTIRELVISCAGLGVMIDSEARDAAGQNQVVVLGDRISSLDVIHLFFSFKNSRAFHTKRAFAPA